MIKELDALRKKTLMFGCYIGCYIEYNWRVIIGYCMNSDIEPKQDNTFHCSDGVYLSKEECEALGVIGHPLTFGRVTFLCTELEKKFETSDKRIFKKGFRINSKESITNYKDVLEDEDDTARLIANSVILDLLSFFRERPELCDENESMWEMHSDREILKGILIRLAKYFIS